MAGGKKVIPQPIDRPLSRAYLRQFKGWSTAYPPGVSDPASMRVMENMQVNRDGSVRIRPGLRGLLATLPATQTIVGGYEGFYLANGNKAYLYAVKDTAVSKVIFKVAYPTPGNEDVWTTLALNDALVNFDYTAWGADVPFFTTGTTYVRYLQIDNKILALSNNGEHLIVFHVGATKKIPKYTTIGDLPKYRAPGGSSGDDSSPSVSMPNVPWILGTQTTDPDPAWVPQTTSLISSNAGSNVYNYAFFYTWSNEFGESKPSNMTQLKMMRAWGNWSWAFPNATADVSLYPTPSGVIGDEAIKAADQLIVRPNGATANSGTNVAKANGYTHFNVYMLTWSDQDSVPVEAIRVGRKEITSSIANTDIRVQITPAAAAEVGNRTHPVPSVSNRVDSSTPPAAGQGIVAADRMVLVNNPLEAAVIRWSTNEQGNYLDMAPNAGGGYKTLTSGNMQVPACVKLWQNPQSADTLTVLNSGTDGYSTSYYMAPASVTSQSDNTIVMGFEETTATPGTVSPYGCEVANNALYHPLDDQLMKSTASNYNITHKAMTDQIVNKWQRLADKHKIVSCFYDQRLYYLVNNPDSGALPAGCMGNEVWVLDLAAEGGSWSRWTVPGCSLQKVELDGRAYLSLVQPDGFMVFDDAIATDDRRDDITGEYEELPVYWRLETNTQGANRAHDAWSHLRQVSVTLGSFTGGMVYGIRGKDQHGQVVDINKIYRQALHELAAGDELPFDAEDHLRIARELKEWVFYAGAVVDEESAVEPSFGQISLVQYRYTPVSVNVGYDFGSVETFEYGRDVAGVGQNTDNGIPQPYLDTSRP
jgi:hypothetical protein